MMRSLAMMLCLTTGAQADVLGLNDYDALFADPTLTVDTQDDGAQVISLPGDIQVMRAGDTLTTLDAGPGGAVGCFVRILTQIAAYQAACDAPFEEELMARHADYRDRVLAFYAENTRPSSTRSEARARFDALAEASIANAQTYCASENDIMTFMRSVLSSDTSAVVDAMIAVPRLPADNPCL